MNLIEKMMENCKEFQYETPFVKAESEKVGVLQIDGKAYFITCSDEALYANKKLIERTGNDCHKISIFFDTMLQMMFGDDYESLIDNDL